MVEIMIVIITASVLLAILFASVRSKGSEASQLMDLETSTCLKGFAILLVLIHHFGQLSSVFYDDHSFLGYLGVTIFLFISGYVTEKQLLRNGKNYVGLTFIKKKIIRLYLPYLLCVVCFAILGRHGFQLMIRELLNIEEDWFLSAITLFFILSIIVNNLVIRNTKPFKFFWGGYAC